MRSVFLVLSLAGHPHASWDHRHRLTPAVSGRGRWPSHFPRSSNQVPDSLACPDTCQPTACWSHVDEPGSCSSHASPARELVLADPRVAMRMPLSVPVCATMPTVSPSRCSDCIITGTSVFRLHPLGIDAHSLLQGAVDLCELRLVPGVWQLLPSLPCRRSMAGFDNPWTRTGIAPARGLCAYDLPSMRPSTVREGLTATDTMHAASLFLTWMHTEHTRTASLARQSTQAPNGPTEAHLGR